MAEHALAHSSANDQYLETPPGSTYEHTDAHAGPMVKFAIWLVIAAIIVHVGLAAMYWLLLIRIERARRERTLSARGQYAAAAAARPAPAAVPAQRAVRLPHEGRSGAAQLRLGG